MDNVLLKAVEKQIRQARTELNKFIGDLASSPLQALLFAAPAYEATARLTVWQHVEQRTRANVTPTDLAQELQDLVHQHSQAAAASGTLPHTCMTQHLSAEYSKVHKKIAFYARNPVAASLS